MNAFLRSWRAEDADALAEVYGSADADLTGNIPDDRSFDGARAWIEQIHRAEAAGTASAFALVVEPDPRIVEVDRRIVGNVMASGIERRHSSAWVSYWIVAAARGAGLTSSALRSFVDQLHDGLGIHRLELGYRTNNPASAKVAKNAGFLVEGREREKLLYDGTRYDTEACARLSTDPRAPGRRLRMDCETWLS